jgi:archaemetzincin
MEALHIIPVGEVELALLDRLAAALAGRLRVSCHVQPAPLQPEFAWEPKRNQYWSTSILKRLLETSAPEVHVLGVAGIDLFVPVLTFVFGEAQIGGRAALVSTHRLRNDFYGLPADADILFERLVKEALHEMGHNFGLKHCADWQCVMTSSHAVEKLDLKTDAFCRTCRTAILRTIGI